MTKTNKILIIDYEPRGIKQLSDPLASAGYDIILAKDGIAGIKTFEDQKPALVLIEAMLPKRHGFEVCQELKRTPHGQQTPVVIVTSVYKGRKYRSQAIHQHKADEYLEKPIAPERLLEVVQRLVGDPAAASAPKPVESTAPAAKPAPPAPEKAPAAAAPAAATPPRPAGDPPAAPVNPSAQPAKTAEAEISERLDQLLGGGGKS